MKKVTCDTCGKVASNGKILHLEFNGIFFFCEKKLDMCFSCLKRIRVIKYDELEAFKEEVRNERRN